MHHTARIKLGRPFCRGCERVKACITFTRRTFERKPQAPLRIATSAVETRPWRNLEASLIWVKHHWKAFADRNHGGVSRKPSQHLLLALKPKLIDALFASNQ